MKLQSSNPALAFDDRFDEYYGAASKPTTATLSGVVQKTGILVSLTCVAGAVGYKLAPTVPWLPIGGMIGAFVFMIIAGMMLRKNPRIAPQIAVVYALIEGIFLGALTSVLDGVLARMLSKGDAVITQVGLALPAFVITVSVLISMLGLYSAGLLKPTERFKAVMGTVTAGLMLTYLIMFGLSFFGISMPFLSLSSAGGSGMTPLIGLGFSLFTLGLASLWLIIDFGAVEEIVDGGAPRYMEWYCGFILLTTLAWIYFEALKLVFRLAMMFGNRN